MTVTVDMLVSRFRNKFSVTDGASDQLSGLGPDQGWASWFQCSTNRVIPRLGTLRAKLLKDEV